MKTKAKENRKKSRPLVVLGEPAKIQRVAKRLTDLNIPVVTSPWPPKHGGPKPEAVVLVLPVAETQPEQALRRAARWARAPVFVTAPVRTSDAQVRDLYRAGATAVFLWPREALMLPRLLAEATAIVRVRGRATAADQALARAVQAHLRLSGGTGGLRIDARAGVARVAGRVDALWRRQQIDDTVARVPGVRATDLSGLDVAPSGRSDSELLSAARAVLRALSHVDEETISLAVHNGYLTVAGTAADRAELGRLLRALSQTHGIRGIENLTTVTRRRKRVERRVALELRRVVADIYPREKITVTVFGAVAVLTGKVANLATRRSVAALVEGHGHVDRVVNKLEVK